MTEKTRGASSKGLLFAAAKRFGLGILILGAFLFLCAGDLGYWNAWLYLLVLSAVIFLFGIYLYRKDQELLQKRLETKEKEEGQKAYVWVAGLSFLLTFGLCGLDYRFGWSQVPLGAVLAALGIMLLGYGLFVLTLMQNRFASRVVEIQQGQRVIDTGVYAVVRHPLYTAAILMFFASPVVLGSYVALIPMLFYLLAILFRIQNEEKVLVQGLEGYEAYREKVRCRLIPFLW